MIGGPPCKSCGAPLPEAPGTREVACAFCGKSQPHPRPFREGQEVLLPSHFQGKLDLARVLSCDGPDRIECEVVGKGKRQTLPIEHTIPVRAPEGLAPNTQVFFRTNVAWEQTWVVSVSGDQVRVKMAGPQFQADVFDKTIDVSQIRVHLDPARRQTRTVAEARVAQRTSGSLGRWLKVASFAFVAVVLTAVAIVVWRALVG